MWDDILKPWFAPLGADIPPVFAVGGAVRDFLLGRPPKDVDVVCREAERLARRLAAAQPLPAVVVPFDKKPWTPCFRVVGRDRPERFLDVVQMNGDDLETDLYRRDFTMNAMAMAIGPGGRMSSLFDPLDGRSDIKRGLIRCCSPQSLRDDPLRIFRAVRLAAELEFSLAASMPAALAEAAPLMPRVASERVQTELFGLLRCNDQGLGLNILDQCGALTVVFPELEPLKGCLQNDYHHLDVWGHTVEVVRYCESLLLEGDLWFGPAFDHMRRRWDLQALLPVIKLAALLHDIGKPASRRFCTEKQRPIFHGHARLGAQMTAAIARRLKMSRSDRDLLVNLVRHHMRPVALYLPEVKEATVIKWFRALGDEALLVLLLSVADVRAKSGKCLSAAVKDRFYTWVRQAAGDYLQDWKPRFDRADWVRGRDLLAWGMSPGPQMGELLRCIREKQDTGEVATREQARQTARQWVQDGLYAD